MQASPLILTVKNREGILFSGEVMSLTSYNDKGKFDILSKHANFISLIKKNIEYRLKTGEIKKIDVDNAVLKVIDNKVDVYLGIGRSTET
ncbi:hypothetical protein A3A76_04485 [Candidatus Woesebacteria bacterium RIFCSPLOWO2_01_FULL_39_23]|uniref:ATP synthase F1 complex delta/epsilon subunit N-terminal domain-containing protein n=1 Tax=Candidatus Woesebacteria bacterium RIFCSPHIGHO2_01_FULL_40_22 TaxID=1802499 RepID=A0A1F7YI72_9BACT|nr:MAG: hypothetical protein A2141_02095 [Candidatus Woesebacteria bacterium RBG_16_40_11]OGM27041.1 MAG: hypothetical protein A2628_02765 [Candidatus Woesebacteria bacterium RIFCSPHIGHO2_01_FULL_40_22]OGM36514.1 MAG: hypothetical protein A3E41_00650 [Candidatus Woesebacteria bacterium RIFCSPHIGHO2_12_FULL_38_9]OGM63276.1 MAG: hypothetical protein A3A76_04485 [Candidatus Woesebacteria bacterium RIFCSPLOWO2_01_FULL_39_23]